MDDLRALARKQIGTCSPDDFLEDLFPIAAESRYPIPVIDGRGRLTGVVRYRAIFDSLSTTSSTEQEDKHVSVS